MDNWDKEVDRLKRERDVADPANIAEEAAGLVDLGDLDEGARLSLIEARLHKLEVLLHGDKSAIALWREQAARNECPMPDKPSAGLAESVSALQQILLGPHHDPSRARKSELLDRIVGAIGYLPQRVDGYYFGSARDTIQGRLNSLRDDMRTLMDHMASPARHEPPAPQPPPEPERRGFVSRVRDAWRGSRLSPEMYTFPFWAQYLSRWMERSK